MSKDRLNVLINGIAMALGFLLPIFILPFIQNRSGNIIFNDLMIGVSYSAFLFVLLDYGQSTYLVVQNRSVKFIDVALIRLVILLIISCLWYLVPLKFNGYATGLFVIALGNVMNTQWIWHRHEKFVAFSIIANINKIAILIMLFLSIITGYNSLFLLFSFSHLLINLMFLVKSILSSDFKEYFVISRLGLTKDYLYEGLLFYLSRVSASYYNMLLIPIASVILPVHNLSTFIVAERFYQLVLACVQPILNMLNSSLRREFKLSKWRHWFFTAATSVIVVLLILNYFGEFIVDILGYNVDLELFYHYIKWFSIAALLSLVSMFTGHPILSTNGLQKIANISVIISVSIFLILTSNIDNVVGLFIALIVAFGLDASIRGIFVFKLFNKW